MTASHTQLSYSSTDDDNGVNKWQCSLSKGRRRRLQRLGLDLDSSFISHSLTSQPSLIRSHLNYLPDDTPIILRKKFDKILSLFSTPGSSGRNFFVNFYQLLVTLISAKCTKLNQALNNESVNILCLGLGNPSVERSSLRQLAFLSTVVRKPYFSPKNVYFYDPLLRFSSREFLRHLGFNILSLNKEGKYQLPKNKITLVVLPHCPPALADSLLAANWLPGILSRIIFFTCPLSPKTDNDSRRLIHLNSLTKFKLSMKLNVKEPDFEGMVIEWFDEEALRTCWTSLWKTGSQSHQQLSKSDILTADFISKFVDQLSTEEHFAVEIV